MTDMRREFLRELWWVIEDKYGGRWQKETDQDFRRLLRGEPADYVIGWVPFLGCRIGLSYRPMIPRPETEFWAEQAIKEFEKRRGKLRILDIFSGSGAIGIAVLKKLPLARVDFAEENKRFLKQIRLNLRLNKISPRRFRVIRSDIFKNIKGRYDVILANPPYVPLLRKKTVAESVLKFEPRRAVFGGRDGLSYIRTFLRSAKNHLGSGGEIWMEFDSPERRKINNLLRRFGYRDFSFHQDQFGRPRHVVMRHC